MPAYPTTACLPSKSPWPCTIDGTTAFCEEKHDGFICAADEAGTRTQDTDAPTTSPVEVGPCRPGFTGLTETEKCEGANVCRDGNYLTSIDCPKGSLFDVNVQQCVPWYRNFVCGGIVADVSNEKNDKNNNKDDKNKNKDNKNENKDNKNEKAEEVIEIKDEKNDKNKNKDDKNKNNDNKNEKAEEVEEVEIKNEKNDKNKNKDDKNKDEKVEEVENKNDKNKNKDNKNKNKDDKNKKDDATSENTSEVYENTGEVYEDKSAVDTDGLESPVPVRILRCPKGFTGKVPANEECSAYIYCEKGKYDNRGVESCRSDDHYVFDFLGQSCKAFGPEDHFECVYTILTTDEGPLAKELIAQLGNV